jgi:hypothetical protein
VPEIQVNARHRRLGDLPDALIALLLFSLFLVPLWLSRGQFLINWDSVQYALGVDAFDLAAHQPHPPGYIGYEILGRIVSRVTNDVPSALTLISVVSGALAPALLFLLGCRMLPRRYALAAAILFGFSPLLGHYGGVALTYAPEVALSLPFVLLVHRAHADGRLRDLLLAGLAFAILGSVRQSAILMLAPLWPLALRPFSRVQQITASAALVGACLVWAVPLMHASGGVLSYVREATDLAGLAVARTAFLTASFTGVLQNVGILWLGLVVGMHVTLFVLLVARRRPGGSMGALSEQDRRFVLTWVAMPLLFFIGIHTGQPGYALLILPAAYLWVGSALAQIARHPKPSSRAEVPADPGRRGKVGLWTLVGVLSLSGAATLVILPDLAYRFGSSEVGARLQQRMGLRSPADLTGGRVGDVPAQSPLATALRQYSTPRNDAYWSRLVSFIDSYPESGSAVLTGIGGPIASGSFRHLGYYLPEHHVYGVGWDRVGSFGYLFETRNRQSNYSVRGLRDASETLRLPDGVRVLLIPDADVAGLLDLSSVDSERWNLQGGASVTVVQVPEGSVLELGNRDERAHIRLRYDLALDDEGHTRDASEDRVDGMERSGTGVVGMPGDGS